MEMAFPVEGQSNAKVGFSWPQSLELHGSELDSDCQNRGIANFQSKAIDSSTVTDDSYYVKFYISVRYNAEIKLSTILSFTKMDLIKECNQLRMLAHANDQEFDEDAFWEKRTEQRESDELKIRRVAKMRALGIEIPKGQF